MFGLIGALLTGGISLAGDFLKGKATEKRLKLENEQEKIKNEKIVQRAAAEAKAKAMVTRMEGDIAWENIWATNSSKSWRIGYITLFATSPYILAMTPAVFGTGLGIYHMDPQECFKSVNASIQAIMNFPDPIHYLCGAVTSAATGIRGVKDFFQLKKGV